MYTFLYKIYYSKCMYCVLFFGSREGISAKDSVWNVSELACSPKPAETGLIRTRTRARPEAVYGGIPDS